MTLHDSPVTLVEKYTYPDDETMIFFFRNNGESKSFGFVVGIDEIHPVSRDTRNGIFYPPNHVRKETLRL